MACPASTECAEFTTTRAPSASNDRAIASPIPLDEPVTKTTLFSKRRDDSPGTCSPSMTPGL